MVYVDVDVDIDVYSIYEQNDTSTKWFRLAINGINCRNKTIFFCPERQRLPYRAAHSVQRTFTSVQYSRRTRHTETANIIVIIFGFMEANLEQYCTVLYCIVVLYAPANKHTTSNSEEWGVERSDTTCINIYTSRMKYALFRGHTDGITRHF